MDSYNIGDHDYNDFEPFGRRCGCPRPSYVERQQVAARTRAFRDANGAFRSATDTITIPVRFIHITDGATGRITADQRRDQMDVLNAAYDGHDVAFSYNENDTVTEDNGDWFRMGHRSAAERAAKTALGQDQESTLNFYTTNGGGLLGWATFPWDLEGDPDMDGVVVLHSSLPQTGPPPYNLGQTATHEVGHWVGLFHTFQGGCGAVGDHVGDTVAHSGPNYGKPQVGQPHNACGPGELAPIKNFMNYVDDDWMDHFTDEQGTRMREMVGTFRPDLLAAVPTLSGCTRVSRVL